MKKILAITLVVSAVLAGCSMGAKKTTPETTTTTTTQTEQMATYPNGIYRGEYLDGEKVEVEFELIDDKFASVKFSILGFGGNDYLTSTEPTQVAVKIQWEELANYLIGKNITAIDDLANPGNIATDLDGMSAATLKTSKLLVALNDGLARGAL